MIWFMNKKKEEDTTSKIIRLLHHLDKRIANAIYEFKEAQYQGQTPLPQQVTEYQAILNTWAQLNKVSLLSNKKEDEKKIIEVFKPYQAKRYQEKANTLHVMSENLELLEEDIKRALQTLLNLDKQNKKNG